MSEDETKRERARETYRAVNGFEAMEPGDVFLEQTLDRVFGEVWTRPALTRRERRLITLATIAMTGAPTAMEVHVRSALASGDLSLDEMIEVATHFAQYAGFPLATGLYTTAQRIAAEIEGRARTADGD